MPEEPEERKSQIEMRKLQGTMLGEAWAETAKRVLEEPESISVTEWTEFVGKWMGSPETTEGFMRALTWFRQYPEYVEQVPVGDETKTIRLPNKPGLSRAFVEAFLTHGASTTKVLLLDKLRDPVMYAAFVLAGRRPTTGRQLEDISELGV